MKQTMNYHSNKQNMLTSFTTTDAPLRARSSAARAPMPRPGCNVVFARGGVSTRLFFPVHPPAHARPTIHPRAPTQYSKHARRHSREMRILWPAPQNLRSHAYCQASSRARRPARTCARNHRDPAGEHFGRVRARPPKFAPHHSRVRFTHLRRRCLGSLSACCWSPRPR
jgi:hypothetical protein